MKTQLLTALLFIAINYSVHSSTEVVYPYRTPLGKPLADFHIDNGFIDPCNEFRQNVKNLCKNNDITGMINFYCEHKGDKRKIFLLGDLFFPNEILEETHLASYAEQNETIKIALLISAKHDHIESQEIVTNLFYANLQKKFPPRDNYDARNYLRFARNSINNSAFDNAYNYYMEAARKKSLRAIFEIIVHYVLPRSETVDKFDNEVSILITNIPQNCDFTYGYIDYIKAYFYQYGESVFPRDLKKANHYYKQAIQKGFSSAHSDYGDFLLSLTSIFSGNAEKCLTFNQFAIESYIQAGKAGIFQGYQKAIEIILRNKDLFNKEVHKQTIKDLFNLLVDKSLIGEHELYLLYNKIKETIDDDVKTVFSTENPLNVIETLSLSEKESRNLSFKSGSNVDTPDSAGISYSETFINCNTKNNNRNVFETLFTEVEKKLKELINS